MKNSHLHWKLRIMVSQISENFGQRQCNERALGFSRKSTVGWMVCRGNS